MIRLPGEDPCPPPPHLVRLFGRLVDEFPADDFESLTPDDLRDLRRILYGLHAILRLHFAQEEEQYLPLLEDGAHEEKPRKQAADF